MTKRNLFNYSAYISLSEFKMTSTDDTSNANNIQQTVHGWLEKNDPILYENIFNQHDYIRLKIIL